MYFPTGIDAYYENVIDVLAYLGDFIIHKCTHGLFHDPLYEPRRLQWSKLWGGYHFVTTDNPIEQVTNYLTHIRSGLLAIDCEPNRFDPTLTLVDCANVASEIHVRTNIWPLMYSSAYALGNLWNDAVRKYGVAKANESLMTLQNCPLWLAADEVPKGWRWTLKQHTENRVTGASAVVDVDIAAFNTWAELTTWWQTMSVISRVNGMKDNNGNIYWPYANGVYKMNIPSLPTPEQMWQSESAAETLRKSLPPYTLGILSLLDIEGKPHDFAVFAKDVVISAGIEPLPSKLYRVNTAVLNTHVASSLASAHGSRNGHDIQLHNGETVAIVEDIISEPTTLPKHHWGKIDPANALYGSLWVDIDLCVVE